MESNGTAEKTVERRKKIESTEEFPAKAAGGEARLYFHQSFPIGSRIYIMDIRPEPDSEQQTEPQRASPNDREAATR